MQANEQLQNHLLDHLAFVSNVRDTVGSITVLQALLTTSKKEWDNSFHDGTNEHLIKGVLFDSKKTDAVRVYIAKLVAQYMRSQGIRTTAWTKATIAADHATNVAITNRITNIQFFAHTDLFKLVATRLMGFDDAVVDLALAASAKEKAELLVGYIATRFDLAEDSAKALEAYGSAVEFFEDHFKEDSLTPVFFIRAAASAISYYSTDFADTIPMMDHFDVLAAFDSEALEFSVGESSTLKLTADSIAIHTSGDINMTGKTGPADE